MFGEDWVEVDRKNAKRYFEDVQIAMKKSSADAEFFRSAFEARVDLETTKLLPERTEFGELRYTPSQGIRAACLAREDAAITAGVQLAILKRLDRNRNYMVVLIVLALCILFK